MADDSTQDKTEQATSRKKEKAQEQGQVARNRDLVSMTAMGGTVLIFYFAGANLFRGLYSMMGGVLSLSYGMEPLHLCRVVTLQGAKVLAPFFISSVVLVFLSSVMQGGFVKKELKFDFGKLNPGQGIKKIFSMQGLTELLKSLLKFAAGGWIVYYIIKKDM
ncbi:MAG: EscU/YscU/HrcU family type III secretion system export apparatus switch protein, partial [Nitrospirota bacterium]|nr:EscU/YscU/HrcU family type III secretion system export apparatus switch protein [Nitrospirota bacterium]